MDTNDHDQEPPRSVAEETEGQLAKPQKNRKNKSAVVAYLLWFFLSAHRIYFGKYWTAIAMYMVFGLGYVTKGLFFGFFAIWWIIDAFLIWKWVRQANEGDDWSD